MFKINLFNRSRGLPKMVNPPPPPPKRNKGVQQPVVDNTTLPPKGAEEIPFDINSLVDKYAGIINSQIRGGFTKTTQDTNLETIKWGLYQIGISTYNLGKEDGTTEIIKELEQRS